MNDHGEHERALELYTRFVAGRISKSGENHSDIALAYNNMGEVYRSQAQHDQALEYYGKSLDIKLATLEPNHLSFASTMDCLLQQGRA